MSPPSACTILVTGTSSGFGKRYVERLLRETPHRVVASLRGGEARARALFSAEWIESAGDRLRFWDLELGTPLDSHAVGEEWRVKFSAWSGGKLDVLVNNAGYGLLGPALDQGTFELRTQFEVNFFAPVTLIHALLPFFPSDGGRVINLSSICGVATFPFYGAYCATKFALEAYTEGLHYELYGRGVQLCLVEPGAFRTDFNARARSEIRRVDVPVPRFDFEREKQAFTRFLVEKQGMQGNPEKVVDLLLRLTTARRIPLRVTVGADSTFLATLRKCTPSRLWAAIMRIVYRRIVYA